MKLLVVVLFVVFVKRTFGISVTFDPAKPALGDTVTISCKRSSSSSASVSWLLDSVRLTTCDGSVDNVCVPSPTGHTFSTDVSADIFSLSLASVALTDCKTYECIDADTPTDKDSKDLSIAKYDSSELVFTEPGTFSSGTISLTTGCVLSPSDVTISWKKVKQNGVEEDLDKVTPSQTMDATGCTDTCHSETSQKVVSSFVHNEYTESDFEEVIFRAYISHSSYPQDQSMKDSVKYKVKKEQHQTDGQCMRQTSEKTALIVGLVLGALCCIVIIYATYVTILKNRLLKKVSSLIDRSGNESRYANPTFASNVTEGARYDGNTESDQEASVQQYTDLSRYANTDIHTYNVINTA